MGRPAVPTAIKLVRGNPGQRAINESEPRPPAANLSSPPSLEGVAKEKWDEIVPLLHSMGVFTAADKNTIERYCQIFEQWVEVRKHVKENGMTQLTQTGYSQLTAEGSLFRSLPADLLKIEREFGMTASARSSMKVGNAETKEDPLEAYLKKRSG